jgi:hypothetical protein
MKKIMEAKSSGFSLLHLIYKNKTMTRLFRVEYEHVFYHAISKSVVVRTFFAERSKYIKELSVPIFIQISSI